MCGGVRRYVPMTFVERNRSLLRAVRRATFPLNDAPRGALLTNRSEYHEKETDQHNRDAARQR